MSYRKNQKSDSLFTVFFSILLVMAILSLFSSLGNNFIKPLEPESGEETTEDTTTEDETVEDINIFSTLTMNCLGDSVTAGGGESWPSYTTYVQSILDMNKVNNYGKGGTTIADVKDNCFLDRYTSMATEADIVCVLGGFNDYDYTSIGTIDDTDTSTFYGALNTLIPALQEMYPNSYIFIVTPYRHWSNSLQQMVDETRVYPTGHTSLDYNTALWKIGWKYDVDVLDLWHLLETKQSDFVDGIHPSETFVENELAPIIADFIKENYK